MPPEIKLKFEQINQLVQKFSSINNEFGKLDLKEKFEINSHRDATLIQFSNLGLQFQSPKTDFMLNNNDLFGRATKAILSPKDKIAAKFRNKSEIAVDEQVDSMIDKRSNKPPKELKADFKKRFENTFNVIEKKQRLNYLEKAVPKRLTNVFLSLGIATLSLATTIAIPAIASPAAPIAATAATVLGAISATLTVISLANSADIIRRDFSSKAKVGDVRHEAKEGVVPSRKWEKEKIAAYTKELEKKQRNAIERRKEPILRTTGQKKVRFADEEITSSHKDSEEDHESAKYRKE
jgi:hypothetical protein